MYFYPNEPKQKIIDQVAQVIKCMSPAYGYEIDVKEHKPHRTNQQNRFYWLNNQAVADFLNDAGATLGYGLPFTAEIVHEINKKWLGTVSTKDKNITQFCEYMTKMFAFWIEKTGGQWQPQESPYGYLEKTGLVERVAL